MSILFKSIQYKLLEIAIDIFFDGIKKNFPNTVGRMILPSMLTTGMFLSEIRVSDNSCIFYNCRIKSIDVEKDDEEDEDPIYIIEYTFESTTGYSITNDGDNPSDDFTDTLDTFNNYDEWLFIE